ncbi:MAG: BrnT family toxin [Candidatus Eisenbacteria bacterium]|nr:BrnT family toxin [Candidatus Eisenbacteria bacterium]
MSKLRFEWDPHKAAENRRKHGISFDEAETVFSDEFAGMIGDPEHSAGEDRFLLLGLSVKLRTLVVAHCYRRADVVIRIISARKATRRESDLYNRRWHR